MSQFNFDIAHIKGRENIVADSLSRIPGTKMLTQHELLSADCTLNMFHVEDLPSCMSTSVAAPVDLKVMFLNGVISVNERSTFRSQLLAEQQAATEHVWF